MSSNQRNQEQLSLRLSEVFDDIGVSDEIIQKRRQSALFMESVYTVLFLLDNKYTTKYLFGSQSEGTTTEGINSDADVLFRVPDFNVINDWSHWKQGEVNLLMVQDQTIAPGYCLLQLLRSDVPLAAEYIPNGKYCMDNKGRVIMKNTAFHHIYVSRGMVQHGPAVMPPMRPGMIETDFVLALPCLQWPIEARRWLTRDNVGGWPSAHLKSESENCGCFLVPVDSKISGLVGGEWRISTTLAERHLMFSLNTIHIKCYVMMKVLLKSYDVFHDVISSYMCKTVLLHCVENTMVEFWLERNLIECFDKMLCVLYNFIAHVQCPHFIIPENNLMAGKISPLQQRRFLEILARIIRSEGRILLEIQIDSIGERIRQKFSRLPAFHPHIKSRLEMRRIVSGDLSYHSARSIVSYIKSYLNIDNGNCCENTIKQIVCSYGDILKLYPQLNNLQKKVVSYISLWMCTTIGSMIASYYISIHGRIPNIAIEWLQSGLNTDVSSSMLKLATVYYSVGNMNVTEDILTRIDQRYDRNVVLPVCGCIDNGGPVHKEGFVVAANNGQVTDFRNIVSYCVKFMYQEVNIVPSELRQEFFRSSQEEKQRRHPVYDRWMNYAVVDSLPYMYFLQYKVYSSQGKNEEKLRALQKLKNVLNEEQRIQHKETVFNLLGQCMEQENLPNDAFHYYERSLQVRFQHNAANFYRARLLS
ncbi:hypothetical protein ACF0H5_023220 [Mactra antiquata]